MSYAYVQMGAYRRPGLGRSDGLYSASVEAIFLSTFVLISQNRAQAATDKRDDLDLHINLLAEHDEGKGAAETLIFDYHRLHGLQVKVARIFNTYGPRMLEIDGLVVPKFHCSGDFIYCVLWHRRPKAARIQNGFAATGFHATIAGDCAQSTR